MASRLILVIGDLFIPDRAPDIPAKFRKLLTPNKIGTTICLGNLTSPSVYDFLRSLSPDLHIVKGDYDIDPLSANSNTSSLPLSKVLTHGSLRIGFTHGHTIIPQGDAEALLIAARQMDVDVMLYGGGAKWEAYEAEGRFFVCPGSATGAFNTNWVEDGEKGTEPEDPAPSFCLMDVQGEVLVMYVYSLRRDEKGAESVGVEKVSFRKGAGVAA